MIFTFYALKNYILVAGIKNVIITTDAMAAAGAGTGKSTLSNIELEVGKDRIVREPGKQNFAGSAIDMKSSFVNLIEKVGLTKGEAKSLTWDNPLRIFINLQRLTKEEFEVKAVTTEARLIQENIGKNGKPGFI